MLGVPFAYATPRRMREPTSPRSYANEPALAGIATLAFGRPVSARNWLQASNPSERWKWDFMFQDMPPVKGDVDPSAAADAGRRDPLEGSEIGR